MTRATEARALEGVGESPSLAQHARSKPDSNGVSGSVGNIPQASGHWLLRRFGEKVGWRGAVPAGPAGPGAAAQTARPPERRSARQGVGGTLGIRRG